jgi:shikimate kinase
MLEDADRAGPASPTPPRRIVLTGFMGAGKTTVGLLLARRLHWRFVDVDALIETATGSSIAQLFERHGEPWFRQLEHETIARLVESSSLVLALGGGAMEDERTRRLLFATASTRVIHLEVSLETVLRRCQGTEALRPILRDREHLEARYRRRLPLYRESHMGVMVDSLAPSGVVEAIVAALTEETR